MSDLLGRNVGGAGDDRRRTRSSSLFSTDHSSAVVLVLLGRIVAAGPFRVSTDHSSAVVSDSSVESVEGCALQRSGDGGSNRSLVRVDARTAQRCNYGASPSESSASSSSFGSLPVSPAFDPRIATAPTTATAAVETAPAASVGGID